MVGTYSPLTNLYQVKRQYLLGTDRVSYESDAARYHFPMCRYNAILKIWSFLNDCKLASRQAKGGKF